MGIIWMIIIGFAAGVIAKLLMPGKDPGGLVVTTLLGIAGSLLAGFLGRAVGWYSEGRGPGLIGSVIGAFLLLGLYRLITRRRHVHA